MTHNEKKSLYESIMKETAKAVKRMINESDESNNKLTNYQTYKIGFGAIEHFINHTKEILSKENVKKGLFIKVSCDDLIIAIMNMFTDKNLSTDSNDFERTVDKVLSGNYLWQKNYFLVLDFEKYKKEDWEILANIADGRIQDKRIYTIPVIVTDKLQFERLPEPIKQRFYSLELKY